MGRPVFLLGGWQEPGSTGSTRTALAETVMGWNLYVPKHFKQDMKSFLEPFNSGK